MEPNAIEMDSENEITTISDVGTYGPDLVALISSPYRASLLEDSKM